MPIRPAVIALATALLATALTPREGGREPTELTIDLTIPGADGTAPASGR